MTEIKLAKTEKYQALIIDILQDGSYYIVSTQSLQDSEFGGPLFVFETLFATKNIYAFPRKEYFPEKKSFPEKSLSQKKSFLEKSFPKLS